MEWFNQMIFMYMLPSPPSIFTPPPPPKGVSQGPLFQVLQNVAEKTAEDGAAVALSGQLLSIWTSD